MTDMQKELVAMGGRLKLKKTGRGVMKKKRRPEMPLMDSVSSRSDFSAKRKIGEEGSVSKQAPTKTNAQLAFERRQSQLQTERVLKKAQMSHREKVEKFNAQMNELTEFNDIPKVSWTK